MRRVALLLMVAAFAVLGAGCGGGDGEETTAATGSADACAKDQLELDNPGELTIGTGNPADFSRSYYDVNQALVALEDADIAKATTTSDLKAAKLGAVVGTTSYQYIVDNIDPSSQPSVYDSLADNVAALKNGQIDGLVTDFPSAYYIANVQLSNAKLVGRFPSAAEQEYFGLTFEKGSSLVTCVDRALDSLEQDETLERLEQRWITRKAQAPLIQAG